ncbi:MAG: phytanoyl-CoA dioxygenase family protein [Alphaproteobacteria bacterium]
MKIVFENREINKLQSIKKTYKTYGLVIFKDFFKDDEIYDNYNNDLETIISLACKNKNIKKTVSDKLYDLRKNHDKVLGRILDLGSKNNKILSGIKLKSSDKILYLVKCLLNSKLIGTMSVSDRLILATNLKKEEKWFQGVHMDYNYVLQTKKSLTAHIGLGNHKNNGGVAFYLKSHKIKNLPLYIDDNGFHKIDKDFLKNNVYKNYDRLEVPHEPKSLILFDSQLLHETIRNTKKNVRTTQIFRYSDLSSKEAISKNWVAVEPKKIGDNYFDRLKF